MMDYEDERANHRAIRMELLRTLGYLEWRHPAPHTLSTLTLAREVRVLTERPAWTPEDDHANQ